MTIDLENLEAELNDRYAEDFTAPIILRAASAYRDMMKAGEGDANKPSCDICQDRGFTVGFENTHVDCQCQTAAPVYLDTRCGECGYELTEVIHPSVPQSEVMEELLNAIDTAASVLKLVLEGKETGKEAGDLIWSAHFLLRSTHDRAPAQRQGQIEYATIPQSVLKQVKEALDKIEAGIIRIDNDEYSMNHESHELLRKTLSALQPYIKESD